MSMNNNKVWIPAISILLALGGSYITAQVAVTEKLGQKVDRAELKEAVKDTRDQIQRELNDIKETAKQTSEEVKETNRLLRQLIIRK